MRGENICKKLMVGFIHASEDVFAGVGVNCCWLWLDIGSIFNFEWMEMEWEPVVCLCMNASSECSATGGPGAAPVRVDRVHPNLITGRIPLGHLNEYVVQIL
jgi:hypothetical protein